MLHTISKSRLVDLYFGDEKKVNWLSTEVTLEDVIKAMKDEKIVEIEEHYDHNNLYLMNPIVKSKDWHLGRIKFLFNHLDSIDPIIIHSRYVDYMSVPFPVIEDGHHRLLAMMVSDKDWFTCDYTGMQSLLDYLNGTVDEVPFETINHR